MITDTNTIALGLHVRKIRSNRRAIHRTTKARQVIEVREATHTGRDAMETTTTREAASVLTVVRPSCPTHFVVTQRKPIDGLPWWVRTLLRWVYRKYQWAACAEDGGSYFVLEFRGSFDDEAEARWAASCPGGSYIEVPFNAALPEETAQFGVHDSPLSEASPSYRRRSLPFVVVPRGQMDRLQDKLRETDPIVEGLRVKVV